MKRTTIFLLPGFCLITLLTIMLTVCMSASAEDLDSSVISEKNRSEFLSVQSSVSQHMPSSSAKDLSDWFGTYFYHYETLLPSVGKPDLAMAWDWEIEICEEDTGFATVIGEGWMLYMQMKTRIVEEKDFLLLKFEEYLVPAHVGPDFEKDTEIFRLFKDGNQLMIADLQKLLVPSDIPLYSFEKRKDHVQTGRY